MLLFLCCGWVLSGSCGGPSRQCRCIRRSIFLDGSGPPSPGYLLYFSGGPLYHDDRTSLPLLCLSCASWWFLLFSDGACAAFMKVYDPSFLGPLFSRLLEGCSAFPPDGLFLLLLAACRFCFSNGFLRLGCTVHVTIHVTVGALAVLLLLVLGCWLLFCWTYFLFWVVDQALTASLILDCWISSATGPSDVTGVHLLVLFI
ncbi:unnamed protein product [Ilex paraguariensis]|uniref:Uncharacterized protein n=1 Tax=Ilex paraguariensis TaxID=185542 RepID=A0ABC8RRX2_9AQUA